MKGYGALWAAADLSGACLMRAVLFSGCLVVQLSSAYRCLWSAKGRAFSLEKVLYWVIPSWAGQVGDW